MATITVEGPDPTNLPDGRATMQIHIQDEGLLLVVQAMCEHYEYQILVSNPDFDPEIPPTIDGEVNPEYKPEKIQNPIGPGTFALMKTVEYWMGHGKQYAARIGAIAGREQVLEQVKPLENVSYSQV